MIRYWPYGPHTSIGNRLDGIGLQWEELNSLGIPCTIKCVDGYGPAGSLMEIGDRFGVENVCVFRLGATAGIDWGVPNWHAPSPEAAAQEHVERTLNFLPPEFDKRVWLELINEPDKDEDVSLGWTPAEYSDWLGRFAQEAGRLLMAQGYKFLAYGYSSGESEIEDWSTPGQLDYLALCAQYPDQLGIALHEYSYRADDIPKEGWLIGRFEKVFEVCDQHGINRPQVYITEFGWTLWELPGPEDAMPQLEARANDTYALHPQILGVAIWHFGTWSNDIKLQAHKLLEPMAERAKTYRLEVDGPTDPPPPPQLVRNYSFEGGWWDLSSRQQVPNEWDLTLYESGDIRGNEITITPECVHKYGPDPKYDDVTLPPDEWLGAENALVLDGSTTYKMFATGVWTAALEQTVDAPPNSLLTVMWPWQIHFDDRPESYDPEDTLVEFFVGDQSMGWWMTKERDRKWFYHELTCKVPASGEVEIILKISVKHAHHVALFTDQILSEATMPEQPPNSDHQKWWDLSIKEQIDHGLQLAPTALQDAIRDDGFHPVTKEMYGGPEHPPMMAAEDWAGKTKPRRLYFWKDNQVHVITDPYEDDPPPIGDSIDLVPYLWPGQAMGPIYEVQHPDGSQERIQHQQDGQHAWIVKGGEGQFEYLYHDATHIWRGIDTSPGGGRFYVQYEPGLKRAKWVKRFMKLGETFYGQGHKVQFFDKGTCEKSAANSGSAQNVIKFQDHYDVFEVNGLTFYDVIELVQPGGEKWFFAKDFGMIGWQSSWGESFVSEIHEPGQRPDQVRESVCDYQI